MNIGLTAVIETQIDKASAQREGQKLQRELEEYAKIKPNIDAEDMAREVSDRTRRDPLEVNVDTDGIADQLEDFERSRENPFSERGGGLDASISRDNPANPLNEMSGTGGPPAPVRGGGPPAPTGDGPDAPATPGGGGPAVVGGGGAGAAPATGGMGGPMDAIPVEVMNAPIEVIPEGGMGGAGSPIDIGPAQEVGGGDGGGGGLAGQMAGELAGSMMEGKASDLMGDVVNNGMKGKAASGAANSVLGNAARSAGRASKAAQAGGSAIAGAGGLGALSKLTKVLGPAGLAVTAAGVVFMGMSKALKALADKAPTLGKGMDMIGQAWNLFWRPFGEALGKTILPMAEGLLEFTSEFNKVYEDEGLAVALGWGVKELAKAIGDYFKDNIMGIFSGDKKKAVEGGASMGTLAGGAIGMALGGPAGMVVGALIGNLVGQLVGHVATAVKNTDWGKIADGIKAGAVGAVEDAFSTLDSVTNDVVTGFEDLSGIDLPDFNAFDTLGEKAGQVADYFGEFENMNPKEIAKKLGKDLAGALSNLGGSISMPDIASGASDLAGGFAQALRDLNPLVNEAVTWFEDFTGIDLPNFDPLSKLADGADDVADYFDDLSNMDAGEIMNTVLQDAASGVSDYFSGLSDTFQLVDDKIGGVVDKFEEFTGIDLPDFSPLGTMADLAGDVADYFETLSGMDAKEMANKIITDIANGISDGLSKYADILSTANDRIDSFVTWVEDILNIDFPDFAPLDEMANLADTAATKLDNLDNPVGTLRSAFDDLAADVKSALPEMPDWTDLNPGVPKWSDFNPGVPRWSDLFPGVPNWSDLNPFGNNNDTSGGQEPQTEAGTQQERNATQTTKEERNTGQSSGGGGGSGTRRLAMLASGGLVTEPTQAIIGEGGQHEAVVPLDRWESMVKNSVKLEVSADDIGRPKTPDFRGPGGSTSGTIVGPNSGGGAATPGGPGSAGPGDEDRIEMDPETQAVLEDVRDALQTIEREIKKGGGETVIKADGRKLAEVTGNARDRFLNSREVHK